MTDPTGNTCAICMDSLWSGEPMGAYVPCGHVFHVHCGEGWRYSRSHDCRCPLCNSPTASFCRIFIDAVEVEQDDDDDLSLDDDDDDERPGDVSNMEAPAKDEGSTIAGCQLVDEMKNDMEDDVICIDDDLAAAGTRSFSASATTTQVSNKYKKKAKQLKRQLAALQIKYDKTVSSLHELRDTCQESQGRIEQLESVKNDLDLANHRQQLELEGIRLEKVRLARQLNHVEQSLAQALKRAEETEKNLKMTRQDHERQMDREKRTQLTEVELINAINKRMQQENVRLKDENKRTKFELETREKACEQLLKIMPARNLQHIPVNHQPEKPLNRRRVAKDLRQMDERDNKRRQEDNRKVDSAKLCQGKLSEAAVRLARASEKSTAARQSALDLLNADRGSYNRFQTETSKRPHEAAKVSIPTQKRYKEAASRPLQQTLDFRRR